MPSLHLMIIDDSPLRRLGLKLLLQQGSWIGFEQVSISVATDVAEAMAIVKETHIDLALIRLELHNQVGNALASQLQESLPKLKCLLYTDQPGECYDHEPLFEGIHGFFDGEQALEFLIPALLSIYFGGYFCQAICPRKQLKKPEDLLFPVFDDLPLTPREAQVLKLLSEEFPREKIALMMSISIRTVDSYRSRLLKKLGVQSSAGLTRYALKSGISQL